MNTNRMIRIFAGAFVLLSLALGAPASPLFVNANWLWFTAFVGANLFQSGFTLLLPAGEDPASPGRQGRLTVDRSRVDGRPTFPRVPLRNAAIDGVPARASVAHVGRRR